MMHHMSQRGQRQVRQAAAPPRMMSAQSLQQMRYQQSQQELAAYQQRYQQSQQELLRRQALLQAQNMQNAQEILRAPLRSPHGNAITNIDPKYRHKLYVKSKDTNCEYAYDYFAKRYNKDVNPNNPNGMSDGYTMVSKRENLERQIEVINILRQPELRPAWIKAVPCLLKYNPADDSWKEYYGSKCMQEMYKIALSTPPDVDIKDSHVADPYNKLTGYTINNTFEYANDPRYNTTGGKISMDEMEEIKRLRQTQDQRYQSQTQGSVDFKIHEDASQRVNPQEYMSRRSHLPLPAQNYQIVGRPEMLY